MECDRGREEECADYREYQSMSWVNYARELRLVRLVDPQSTR